ncbi:hypothetical protein EIP86_008806 [Pleurotus ostreatoroseus]|nr:hypothetical protein EIP86_008806 [Pleurotus ostreatoroseus]
MDHVNPGNSGERLNQSPELVNETNHFGLGELTTIERKRQYNATLPIAKFAPELVAKILEAHYEQWSMNQSIYDWLAVTHISHYWRSVALNTAKFWSRIPILSWDENLSMFREWLSRAQGAPLTIEIWLPDLDEDDEVILAERVEAYNMAMEHLAQVRSLHIHLPETLLPQLRWPMSSADILETLWFDIAPVPSGPPPFDLLSVLSPMPKLVALNLEGASMLWGRSFFPGSLRSAFIIGSNMRPHSFAAVLENLANAPLLETLFLQSAFNFTAKSSSEAVHLPRLTSLHLSGEAAQTVTLLKHIVFPVSARISLNCSIRDTSITLRDILTPISIQMNKTFGGGRKIRKCHILFNDRDLKPCLIINCNRSIEDDRGPCENNDFDVYVSVDDPQVTLTGLWHGHMDHQAFLASLPLAEVEDLSINGWPLFSADHMIAWFNLFTVLSQNVRYLSVFADRKTSDVEMCLPVILRFATPVRNHQDDPSSRRELNAFPILEHLRIVGCKFQAATMGGTFSTMLLAYLKMRRINLRSLDIIRCYDVTQQDIDILTAAGADRGVEIMWDGKEETAPLVPESHVRA